MSLLIILINTKITFLFKVRVVKVKGSKYKAHVFMVSLKRIKLSIPDEKASSLVLVDADSPFFCSCEQVRLGKSGLLKCSRK